MFLLKTYEKATCAKNYTRTLDISTRSNMWELDLCPEAATWILTCTFVIFTMQTGFGCLESGCVSIKNESNIMMKNLIDIVLGGFTYWAFGFSMSFGNAPGSTTALGIGDYFVDAEYELMGPVFAAFLCQLAFATTATTIVSGAMAERCNFKAYCAFSLLNTIVYCVPARWLWHPTGFLYKIGVIDVSGSGGVHLLGGTSGFVAAWMLGARMGRYDNGIEPLEFGNPLSSLVGLFVLWWGWLAFNSVCAFGLRDDKWRFAPRAAVNTIVSSLGGGIAGSAYGFINCKLKPGKYFEVADIVNPILGSLVAVTAGCAVYHTMEAFVTGLIGGCLVLAVSSFADRLGVDDPVGATAVHGFGGLWGMLAIGFFTEEDGGVGMTNGSSGLFRGGGLKLLQAQLFASLCIFLWSGLSTFIILWVINKFIPIRMEAKKESVGADLAEHTIHRNLTSGEVITSRQDLGTVALPSRISCNSYNSMFREYNLWRRIRMKAFVISFLSLALREKRNRPSTSSVFRANVAPASNNSKCLCFEENLEYFRKKSLPRKIFLTEDFYRENYITVKERMAVEDNIICSSAADNLKCEARLRCTKL